MVDYSASKWIDETKHYQYPIRRSLALRAEGGSSTNGGYLEQDGSSGYTLAGTSTKIFTFATWVKRGRLCQEEGRPMVIFQAGGGHTDTNTDFYTTIGFDAEDRLVFVHKQLNGSAVTHRRSKMKFRDIASWYHILVRVNTPNATEEYRVQLYVNGSQLTADELSLTNTVTQNADFYVNAASVGQRIGGPKYNSYLTADRQYFDGYLADIHMVDGTEFTYGYFAMFRDSALQPRNYWMYLANPVTSYGNKGFNFTFDTGSLVDRVETIPAWTMSNNGGTEFIGTTLDTPTNNFPVWNQLLQNNDTANNMFYSLGGLMAKPDPSGGFAVKLQTWATMAPSFRRGKWFGEVHIKKGASTMIGSLGVGVAHNHTTLTNSGNFPARLGMDEHSIVYYASSAIVYNNQTLFDDSANYPGGPNFDNEMKGYENGYTVGVLIDYDTNATYVQISFFRSVGNNSELVYTANIDNGKKYHWTIACQGDVSNVNIQPQMILNCGQDITMAGHGYNNLPSNPSVDNNGIGQFRTTSVPQDFLALCTHNLEPVFFSSRRGRRPQDVVSATRYVGNSVYGRMLNLDNNPDFLWFVSAVANNWYDGSFDRVRSQPDPTVTTNQKALFPALNFDEKDQVSWVDYDDATEGFHFEDNGLFYNRVQLPHQPNSWSSLNHNYQGATYNVFYWNAGSRSTRYPTQRALGATPVTNSDGSISTSLLAHTDAGFSLFTYTGTGANATVGHGLNKTPEFFMIKNRDIASTWVAYHKDLSANAWIRLDTDAAQVTNEASAKWNSTAPTNTVISLGTDQALNNSNESHVCYCWHTVEGLSWFDFYEGTGSSDETPFFYTGFSPAIVLIKNIDAVENWHMWNFRDSQKNPRRFANRIDISATSTQKIFTEDTIDFLSNGFKLRSSTICNTANTYIFAAWAFLPQDIANAL
jgi:hypothetical protein